MDMNKGTDINVGSIEEDIKRCEKLTKPQNANWIGISNQIAIAHVIERIKELEAKLEFYQWGDLDNLKFEEYMKEFIPKQKVKEELEEAEKENEPYEKYNKESRAYWINQGKISLAKTLLEDK